MTDVLSIGSLAGLDVMKAKQKMAYINMLIYGESGVGKTTLMGSVDLVPEMRPMLTIDVEGGTMSLSHSYPDVDVVRVKTWKEMQQVYDELYHGHHKYQSVGVDSLTETQKFSMYNIMEDLKKNKPEADPDVPGMREWGKNIEQLRRFVRGFRDLPMNTIFTALVRADKNTKTGAVTKKPSLSGKVADEVAGFLDIVAYAYTKIVRENDESVYKRLLLTQPTEEIIAKDRTGKLPTVMENPTFRDLYSIINPNEIELDPINIEE